MRLLLDTHLVIWTARQPARLSTQARTLITDPDNDILFSVVSVWEVAIKHGLKRADFNLDPGALRHDLLVHGYTEMQVTGPHAIAVAGLPLIHRDPFDRLLVAQALVTGATLLTVDEEVAQYPGSIRQV